MVAKIPNFLGKYSRLLFSCFTASVLIVLPIVAYQSFLHDYTQLDLRDVKDDVARSHRTFLERFHILEAKANDWGAWDDAFNLVKEPEGNSVSDFISSNITETVVSGLDVSFLAYLGQDLAPKTAWSYVDGKLREVDGEKISFLASTHPLISNSGSGFASDFVLIEGRPALATAKVVSKGDGSGPPAGRVVFARLIDEKMIRSLIEQTHLDISVDSVEPNEPVNSSFKRTKSIEIPNGKISLTDEKAFAVMPLIDRSGNTVSYLKIVAPREILLFGERSSEKIAVILGCLLAVMFLMALMVLKLTGFEKRLNTSLGANRLLKERESYLQALIDSVPGYVSWFDRSLRYLGVNKKLAADFGGTVSQFVGRDIGWNNAESSENFRYLIDAFFEDSISTKQFSITTKVNNENRVFLVSLEKYQDGEAVVAVGIDTTAQWLAEEQSAKNKMLAFHTSRLSALGEMAAGVAHEINNPLTIIAGTVRMLPKFVHDAEKFAQKQKIIDRAIERISKIVGGLKKFSRSPDNRQLTRKPLKDLLEEAVFLTATKALNHSVAVKVTIEADPNEIFCDEIEIEQVIVNLINNGIDAVKNLPQRWIHIILREHGSEIVLRVMDSGNGIPIGFQEKLFQPFFTTKSVGEGTGLGLSIVKGILDEHKATIEIVNSELNTCFEIKFPKLVENSDAA